MEKKKRGGGLGAVWAGIHYHLGESLSKPWGVGYEEREKTLGKGIGAISQKLGVRGTPKPFGGGGKLK